jgi:hypothetical protein
MALLNGRNRITRLLAIFLAGAVAWADARGQTVDEYQVKAAFLYNFAKFVEWPPRTFKSSRDPITICIVGQSPVGAALEQAVNSKTIDARAFVIRQVAGVQPSGGCQILFVGASERKRLKSILGEVKTSGVLTVGEMDGFVAEGGVVNFTLEEGKIRFQINLNAAEQQKLRISSKLLSLAQIVTK